MRKCTGRVRLLEIPDAKKGTLKKAITLRVQPVNTTLKITRHEETPVSQGNTVKMKCSVKTEALLEKGRLLFPDDCKDTSKGWKPFEATSDGSSEEFWKSVGTKPLQASCRRLEDCAECGNTATARMPRVKAQPYQQKSNAHAHASQVHRNSAMNCPDTCKDLH